jgi:hypothetical protein
MDRHGELTAAFAAGFRDDMRRHAVVLAALSLAAASCREPAPPDPRSPTNVVEAPGSAASMPEAPPPGAPAAPDGRLASLCAREPAACAPFAEAAAQAQACGKSDKCHIANVGTCGPWRYVETAEGFYDTTRIYSAAGALVSSCTYNLEYGHPECHGVPPRCTLRIDQSFGKNR